MPRTATRIALFFLAAVASVPAANDAGRDVRATGPAVTLQDAGKSVILRNGRITATIQKANAAITSFVFDGTQMVDPEKRIYFSMDGGKSFDGPNGCAFAVHAAHPDMIDVSFLDKWSPGGKSAHAVDFEIHYVLRRGDTGIYSYAVLSHPASYPAMEFGEWRMVWWLPHEGDDWVFERVHVDSARTWDWGTYADYRNAADTEIGEIKKFTTGKRKGQYDGKYQYAAEYHRIGTWGHTGARAKKGAWLVFGSCEFFNDGPKHLDLTLADGYNLVHFGRNHFGGSTTKVASGESWRKMYGPYLLYCNATNAAENPWEALWHDARARVSAETAAWPYEWMRHPEFPGPGARGGVTGNWKVNDPLKPGVSAANAWIGLAADEEGPEGNWQYQSKGYQVWGRADAGGNFTLRGVRPGEYTLYAMAYGATGEYSRKRVKVTAGETTRLGQLEWIVPRAPGEWIAWEIGTPDRSASEFFHGRDYWNAFLWRTYCKELPNPLEFTIGKSHPATDWNYAHSGYLQGGTWSPWKWKIKFELPDAPKDGTATLTLAFAGSDSAHLLVYLNDEKKPHAFLRPPNGGGNALVRQGNHAKYGLSTVMIPSARFKQGENAITLVQGRADGPRAHVMYDSLSLVMPGAAAPPPP